MARGDLHFSTGTIAGNQGVIQGQNLLIDTQGQAADFSSGLVSVRGELELNSGALAIDKRQQQGVTAQAESIGAPAVQQAVMAVAPSATDSGSA